MDGWVWSNGGMILTGENWSTGRKTLYSVGGRWMDEYGAMVEWYWQGKTEVLGEKHYTVWVVDEWMGMEEWWNDTDRGKLKYWDRNLFQCYFITYELIRNRSRSSAVRRRRLSKQWHCLGGRHVSSTQGWVPIWMAKKLIQNQNIYSTWNISCTFFFTLGLFVVIIWK